MMGKRSWFLPSNSGQRGFPAPLSQAQSRDPAWPSMHGFGGVIQVHARRYSDGAAGFVPNFGKVLTNPIGAGVVANYRTQASYGPAGQYVNRAIWWASRTIPTSVNMNGLTSPAELAALLGNVNVQAVVRTG